MLEDNFKAITVVVVVEEKAGSLEDRLTMNTKQRIWNMADFNPP